MAFCSPAYRLLSNNYVDCVHIITSWADKRRAIMTEYDPSQILMQGAKIWNDWRERNPGPVSFIAPHWYDSPGPGGVQVKGRNRVNFSGMNLSGVSIYKASAEGLRLRDSVFEDAFFEEGDFSRADFSGAMFRKIGRASCRERV